MSENIKKLMNKSENIKKLMNKSIKKLMNKDLFINLFINFLMFSLFFYRHSSGLLWTKPIGGARVLSHNEIETAKELESVKGLKSWNWKD